MGVKFCNLNLRIPENTVAAIFHGLTARRLVPGWVTLTGETLTWGETQKRAAQLSRLTHSAVLSTEYFNDDYARFTVFTDGKCAAQFAPAEHEGFPRVPGNPAEWRRALDLPESAEGTLKAIFQERDPETALRLLECVAGCPLWADPEEPDRTVLPDGSALAEYLARERSSAKIKNQTKASLLDRIPCRDLRLYNDLALLDRDGDGKRPVIVPENGRLRELFRTDRAEGVQTLRRDPRRGNVFLRMSADGGRGMVLSGAGEPLDEFPIPPNSPCECLFLDEERLFLNGKCRNFRARADEWRTERRAKFECFSHALKLPDGGLFFFRETLDGQGARYSLNVVGPDGRGRAERELPSGGFCRDAALTGEGLLLRMSSPDCLATLDFDLKERWSLPLADRDDPIHMDAGTGTVYLQTDREALALDLASRRFTASRPVARGEHLWVRGLLPGVGPLVSVGASSVEVWDCSLNPLSRHRLRGTVSHMTEDGYILTASAPRNGGPGALRLYGIARKEKE